jgi:uncharacterized protein (DUF305 family)
MRRLPICRIRVAVALAAIPLGVLLPACGDDDGATDRSAKGRAADAAFLRAMIPHHESAIQMANVAKQRAQHPQIERLAVDIIAAQSDEIIRMHRIYRRLFRTALTPHPMAHERLGLSPQEAGMAHMDAAKALTRARPFDRAFIDEMVSHHQGAIRMARAVMAKTNDREIEGLAEAIVSAQSREIGQMNQWRAEWYGAPSPAGGVPKDPQDSNGMGMGIRATPGRRPGRSVVAVDDGDCSARVRSGEHPCRHARGKEERHGAEEHGDRPGGEFEQGTAARRRAVDEIFESDAHPPASPE